MYIEHLPKLLRFILICLHKEFGVPHLKFFNSKLHSVHIWHGFRRQLNKKGKKKTGIALKEYLSSGFGFVLNLVSLKNINLGACILLLTFFENFNF